MANDRGGGKGGRLVAMQGHPPLMFWIVDNENKPSHQIHSFHSVTMGYVQRRPQEVAPVQIARLCAKSTLEKVADHFVATVSSPCGTQLFPNLSLGYLTDNNYCVPVRRNCSEKSQGENFVDLVLA